MQILITGAGLLGAYATAPLKQKGHQVLLYDRDPDSSFIGAVCGSPTDLVVGDVRNVDVFASLLARHHVDTVVHTAGCLSGAFKRDAFDAFSSNTLGVLTVAEAARRAKTRRVILASSLSVYDFSQEARGLTEEAPLAPESLYDHSKLIAELMLRAYCQHFGIELIILRFAGLYGPGPFKGGAWMGKKIHSLLVQARNQKSVEVHDGDLGTNEYLYVKDAANAICAASSVTTVLPTTINIGSGQVTTPTELADALKSVIPGTEIHLVRTLPHDAPVHLRRTTPLSLTKARTVLHYAPAFPSVRDGLWDYVCELDRLRDVLAAG